MRGGQLVPREVGSRLDEPLRVEHDAPVEPARARSGACHDEDVPDVPVLDGAGQAVAPAHAFEMVTPRERHERRVRPQDDRGVFFDAPNQVP
jgi:hypothetical protein